jgi:serine protease inhibitor
LIRTGEPAAIPSGARLREAARGESAFALSLYAQLSAARGNTVLAPTSIATVLGMVAAGAKGATEKQILDAIGTGVPAALLHSGVGGLARALTNRTGEGVTLSEVDQAWVQKGLQLLDPFTRALTVDYAAPLATLDFSNRVHAAQVINAWVSEGTHGKIPKLLDASMLDNAALVLTDAVYLDARWEHGFDAKDTFDRPFRLADGSTVNVPTMAQTEEIGFAQGDGYTAASLPYKGGALEMDVVVPDDLARFEVGFDAGRLDTILSSLAPTEAQVALPKFEFRKRFADLRPPLAALGVRDVFDPDRANLSGMSGDRSLYVSALVHEAFVHVDEQGTIAAGATGGVVGVTAAPSRVFSADRPFLFAVRDKTTGAIVFLGRVDDPRAG